VPSLGIAGVIVLMTLLVVAALAVSRKRRFAVRGAG
jgi:hypothetical protein